MLRQLALFDALGAPETGAPPNDTTPPAPVAVLPAQPPPLAFYDRYMGDEVDTPLMAHELAALAHHGYAYVGAEGRVTTLDTADGRLAHANDFWRSEIDVLWLLARKARGGGG